jgi:excisionase family DNA binding protein
MTATLALPGSPGGIAIFLEQLIERLADLVAARIGTGEGPAKRLMTIAEAAEYIGRSRRAVEAMIVRGTIPVTKLDGRCQVDRVALDKLISDRTYREV